MKYKILFSKERSERNVSDMNKLIEWKERLKKGHMLSIIVVLLIAVAILGMILYKKKFI